MSRWIDNSLADRMYMVDQVSERNNIDPESVEKGLVGNYGFEKVVWTGCWWLCFF